MAGAEATETFQTVKTRLRCQIDQNLIRKAVADPQSREDLEAVLIPEATLVNRVAVKSQVSHLAGQRPPTRTLGRPLIRDDPKAVLIPETTVTIAIAITIMTKIGPRPHQEDFMAVLIPGTNLTKT